MAKHANQPPRMMLTDFDSPDSRRQSAVSAAQSLFSITDLADTLEFDFEDDAGDEAPAQGRTFEKLRSIPARQNNSAAPKTISGEQGQTIKPQKQGRVEPTKSTADRWAWFQGKPHEQEEQGGFDEEQEISQEDLLSPQDDEDDLDDILGQLDTAGVQQSSDAVPSWYETPEAEYMPGDAQEAEERPGVHRGMLGGMDDTHVPYRKSLGGIEQTHVPYRKSLGEIEQTHVPYYTSLGGIEEPRVPHSTSKRVTDTPAVSATTGRGFDELDLSDLFEVVDQASMEQAEQARHQKSNRHIVDEAVLAADSVNAAAAHTVRPDQPKTLNTGIFSDIDIDALWEEKFTKGPDAQDARQGASSGAASAKTPAMTDNDFAAGLDDLAEDTSRTVRIAHGVEKSDTVIIDQDELQARASEMLAAAEQNMDGAAVWDDAGQDQPEDLEGFLDQLIDEADASQVADQVADQIPEIDTGDPFNLDDLIAETDAQTNASMNQIDAPVVDSDAIITPGELLRSLETEAEQEQQTRVIQKQASSSSRRKTTDADAFDEFPPEEDTSHVVAPNVSDNDLFGLPANYEASLPEAEDDEEELDPEIPWDPHLDDEEPPADAQTPEAADTSADGAAQEASDGEPQQAGEEEAAIAVDPNDVFANMDDMDFSGDGLDDEMKAMLAEDEAAEQEAAAGADNDAAPDMPAGATAAESGPPTNLKGKVLYFARKGLRKILPASVTGKITAMVAWHDNWWLYCDLAAAVIASASLAVIISYYLWYNQ